MTVAEPPPEPLHEAAATGPWLPATVAISGACVLAIEILGTRLLGPFYGVDLFLWSALISTTLAALSLGYVLGGRWADRGPRRERLAMPLAIAGAWMLLVPWLRHPLLTVTDAWGPRAAVLVAALVLFFPPLTLLGMVGPYAIRLRTQRLGEVGRTAGDLFALSTVASVAAALATGFWLIPGLGVTRLTIGVAIVLALTSMLPTLGAGRARAPRVLALLVGLAGLARLGAAPAASAEVRFVGESPYAEIRVLDHGPLRMMLLDGGTHTIIERDTGRPRQSYVELAELAQDLFPAPGAMLLIGLGGGSTVKSYVHAGWTVDAVELDPLVVSAARDWFDLKPDLATVHVMDGRRFLTRPGRSYDVILLDAFGSGSVPFHLVTEEVFRLVYERLNPGGVVVVNLEAQGWHDRIVHGLGHTLARVFRHVVALPIAEPPDQLGNVVLYASDRSLELDEAKLGDPVATLIDDWEHWRVLQRTHGWENRFDPSEGPGTVLTDDRNPIDVWSQTVNLAARRELHKELGTAAW
jgi:spermidine synthase